MTQKSRGVRIQLLIALMCAALLVYIVLLGRTAVLMIGLRAAVAIALGRRCSSCRRSGCGR